MDQLYSNTVVNLSYDSTTAIEDYSGMQVVVRQRRSSVESPAKVQLVQQMKLKSQKVNEDLKLAQPSSCRRQSSSGLKISGLQKPEIPMMKKALNRNNKDSSIRSKNKKPKGGETQFQKLDAPNLKSNSTTTASVPARACSKNINETRNAGAAESRPRKLTKREDPNIIGYVPRPSHRHEHQRQRARQFENYICGAPLHAGLDSDSD